MSYTFRMLPYQLACLLSLQSAPSVHLAHAAEPVHRRPSKRRRLAHVTHVVSPEPETKRGRRRRAGRERGKRQHEARVYLSRFGK